MNWREKHLLRSHTTHEIKHKFSIQVNVNIYYRRKNFFSNRYVNEARTKGVSQEIFKF